VRHREIREVTVDHLGQPLGGRAAAPTDVLGQRIRADACCSASRLEVARIGLLRLEFERADVRASSA
jgi:hypothetical protein